MEGQGVAKSGVRVYTRLPVFNGANLEDVCPGSYTVKEDQPSASCGTMSKSKASDKIPAIILMSLQVAVVPVAAIGVEVLVSRERSGSRSSPPLTLTKQPWDNSDHLRGNVHRRRAYRVGSCNDSSPSTSLEEILASD